MRPGLQNASQCEDNFSVPFVLSPGYPEEIKNTVKNKTRIKPQE